MLFEKKMLILSGDGKGVVLIEKNAHGATFSLRTFDLPAYGPLKAGLVTRTAVYVRDLPDGNDPAVTFTVPLDSISNIHFAVFDRRLRLYGSDTKKMWEANLMDLLVKHDRRPEIVTPLPVLPPIQPISPKPEVLPLPDGTGIPQSRLSNYGDEAIADSDFYTPINDRLSERMREVDSFLSTPRVSDTLAPRVLPHEKEIEQNEAASAADEKTTVSSVVSADEIDEIETVDENTYESAEIRGEVARSEEEEDTSEAVEQLDLNTEELAQPSEEIEQTAAVPPIENIETEVDTAVDTTPVAPPQKKEEVEERPQNVEAPDNGERQKPEKTDIASGMVREFLAEAAAVEDTPAMPWEEIARWLKKRSHRELVVKKQRVRSAPVVQKVRQLRECAFFERTHANIETLFGSAPKDGELKKLLPEMEWIKVEFDGHAISVGKLGNELLCYAVKGGYEKNSPLGNEAQWLPKDKNMPTGKGFWLIFQNLSTGEIIVS